jgi:hypothetical protein
MPRYVGDDYLHDGDGGKGEKSAEWTFALAKPGRYEVRLAYSANPNRSRAVPVRIVHRDGESVVRVDQTKQPPFEKLFISVGTFSFGETGKVILSNAGTSGHVIVDAVQLLEK